MDHRIINEFKCLMTDRQGALHLAGLDGQKIVVTSRRLEPLNFKQQADGNLDRLLDMFDSMPKKRGELTGRDAHQSPEIDPSANRPL